MRLVRLAGSNTALIFAQAMIRFPKLFITLFIYISLVGNLAYFTRPRLQREQWRQAINFTQNHISVVKFSGSFAPQVWYAPQAKVIGAVPSYPAKPDQVSQVLNTRLMSGDSPVYLYDYLGDLTDPNREVDLALINLGYQKVETKDFAGVGFIHLFQRI